MLFVIILVLFIFIVQRYDIPTEQPNFSDIFSKEKTGSEGNRKK